MTSIEKLRSLNKQVFTASEALAIGVSGRLLNYHLKSGELERLSHGLYSFKNDLPFSFQEVLKEKIATIPQAVVGLFSVLTLFDLTDEPATNIHLIVPHSNSSKKKLDGVVLHKRRGMSLVDIKDYQGLRVTSLEQTFVDLLNHKEPIGSVRAYLEKAQDKGHEISFNKLIQLGGSFRAKQKVNTLLESLSEN